MPAWLQGLCRPTWFTFHIWSPLIRLACNLGMYLSLLMVHNLLGSWNWAFAWVLFLIWTFVDHLAQLQMIGLNSVGNDHRSNRSVSSYRSFAKDVMRLQQSLTRSRRPR
jgi:hypothetical protein